MSPSPTLADGTPEGLFGPPPAGEDPLLAVLADVALAAATVAVGITAAGFGQARSLVETKSTATDMVSEIDRGSEAAVAAVLAERRPDDGMLGEEGADRPSRSGVRWLVDPLDGTTNYLFGIPGWSVSVAAELDGRIVVGVVADPSRGETWAAVTGRGARCNGAPVAVAEGRSGLAEALVSTGFSYEAGRRVGQAAIAAHVLPRVRDLRRFGSAALDLCWVAGGRVDAYFEAGLNPWDWAAGTLICQEAGGRVERLPGATILATTPSLQAPMTELLTEAARTAG